LQSHWRLGLTVLLFARRIKAIAVANHDLTRPDPSTQDIITVKIVEGRFCNFDLAINSNPCGLLGINPETVKMRLHRARQLSRDQLDKRIEPVLLNIFPLPAAVATCDRGRADAPRHCRIVAEPLTAQSI